MSLDVIRDVKLSEGQKRAYGPQPYKTLASLPKYSSFSNIHAFYSQSHPWNELDN